MDTARLRPAAPVALAGGRSGPAEPRGGGEDEGLAQQQPDADAVVAADINERDVLGGDGGEDHGSLQQAGVAHEERHHECHGGTQRPPEVGIEGLALGELVDAGQRRLRHGAGQCAGGAGGVTRFAGGCLREGFGVGVGFHTDALGASRAWGRQREIADMEIGDHLGTAPLPGGFCLLVDAAAQQLFAVVEREDLAGRQAALGFGELDQGGI